RRKRTDDEIALCREAVAAGYTKLRWRLAGLLSERQGCMDEAERLLEEELASGNLDARIGLAELLVGLGRTADVESLWREAVAGGVENSRSGLAGFLREQGRVDEAIAFLREAIEAGEDPYAWKWLADMYEQQGRIEEAAGARREAIATGEDINAWSSFCHLLE